MAVFIAAGSSKWADRKSSAGEQPGAVGNIDGDRSQPPTGFHPIGPLFDRMLRDIGSTTGGLPSGGKIADVKVALGQTDLNVQKTVVQLAIRNIENQSFDEPMSKQVVETLVTTQGPKDPQRWMTWIQSLKNENLAAKGVESLVTRIVQQDSILASKMARQLPAGRLRKSAYLAISGHLKAIGATEEAQQYQTAANHELP